MEKADTKSELKNLVKSTSQSTGSGNVATARMASPKSPPREATKTQEFKLHTQERAVKRAIFNYANATKFYLLELQKKQEDKLLKMIEEEEIRMLRKEMIPRAQLMPYFDKPFFPQRSSRALTRPREPSFQMMCRKSRSCCVSGSGYHNFHHNQAF